MEKKTMPMEPVVTALSLVNGRPAKRSDFIESWAGKGLFTGIRFHALAEATSPENEELCHWALDTLRKHMGLRRGSLTTRLVASLQACHQELLAANRERKPQERVGLGLTCVAFRDMEFYICSAGPALLYMLEKRDLRRLGPRRDEAQVVGAYEGALRPYLHRAALEEDYCLLVSFSSLLRLVTPEGIKTILTSAPMERLRKLAILAQEEPSYSAILLHAPPSP